MFHGFANYFINIVLGKKQLMFDYMEQAQSQ